MSGPSRIGSLPIDAVATSGGLSALAGLASVGWPFFNGMAAALAALALVGWLTAPSPGPACRGRTLLLLEVAATVVGWAFFLIATGPAASGRGAVLGASAGLVGWVGRRGTPFGEGR